MQFKQASGLLSPGIDAGSIPQTWADLGCGSGLFTRALLKLLPDGSRVFAVDKKDSLETALPGIEFVQADFLKDELPFAAPVGQLDGLLMANALHYVKDKEGFIDRLEHSLKPGAAWVVIEYETGKANPWVPFPIPFSHLQELFSGKGYARVEKISEQPSIYQGTMYCARISRS